MSEKTDKFISTLAVLARNEYLTRDKWVLPSVCIAQAALESGWNLNAGTLFGIKGKGFTASTSEYYNGHYVEIQDSFRSYPNVASAVVGYYDFLADTPRYAGVINNSDYKDAVDKLIHTTDGAPYATDPNYISKVISIIEQYDLTQYDTRDEIIEPTTDTKYHIGDEVNYNTIYVSSTSDEGLNPTHASGRITRVIPGARNPYLIGEDTGWINDDCIVDSEETDDASSSTTYTVQSGDCLSVIGEKLGVDWHRIAEVNDISGPDYTIYPGQVLTIE